MNDQLSLIPDSPIQNANMIVLKPRPLGDVADGEVIIAFDECNSKAVMHGWHPMESVDAKSYKHMRNRLCEQRVIDDVLYTGLPLIKKILEIIENDNFLCRGKKGGMSVRWIIGPINFDKVATGYLGRSNNGNRNHSTATKSIARLNHEDPNT